jgi:hypothetical protein
LGGRGSQISEFKANLVYKVSSRTARATQRNPVPKNKKQNKQTKNQKKQKKKKQKQKNKKQKTKPGSGGSFLSSQHSGGRGRRISVCLQNKNKKPNNKNQRRKMKPHLGWEDTLAG